ncbi:MAG: hypothetical protein GX086_09970 [Alcaligenaceae bacterium]|nr:hypothetical protein [Alcaligenaceae bacterium]
MIQKYKRVELNPEIHISRHELVERYASSDRWITRLLRTKGVVQAGYFNERRDKDHYPQVPFWDKGEAISVLDIEFGLAEPEVEAPKARGEIVPPRTPSKFKPLRLGHHRLADINAAQPPMGLTMGGIGNGAERQHGFSRGA